MDDYSSAAVRHFRDAKVLEQASHLDNAGHLLGFAAECAIKYKIASMRPTNGAPHGHFPDILIAARKHLGSRGNYSSMYEIVKGNVFSGWSVNRRYHVSGNTTGTELSAWFTTAKRLMATANIRGDE